MTGLPGRALSPPAAPGTSRSRVVGLVRLYAALLRTELQAASAYRGELLLSAFAGIVPLAFLALWRGAAAESPVEGITSVQFSTYFCVIVATTSLQITLYVVFDLGDLIYSGQLSAQLLRPVHPAHWVIARGISHRAFAYPVVLALVPVALALTGGRFAATPVGWLVALVVAALGFLAVAHLAAISAAIAFWMTKAQGVQGLVFGAEWLIGGIVAPVALLPGWLPVVARHQPVWFADAAAPEILSGITEPSAWLVLEALGWVVVLHVAFRLVWRRGIRRYEAVGT